MKNWFNRTPLLVMALLILGCGQKEEPTTDNQQSKIKEAVEQAVTREFKLYEGAKQSLEKIERQAEERRDKEKESSN